MSWNTSSANTDSVTEEAQLVNNKTINSFRSMYGYRKTSLRFRETETHYTQVEKKLVTKVIPDDLM